VVDEIRDTAQARGQERPALLYDRDCGFCRASLRVVGAWDRGERLRPVALQDPEAVVLLAGVGEAERMDSWHLVWPDGTRRSAGAALAPLLRLLPGGRAPAALFDAFPAAAEAGYRQIARHRSGLGTALRRLRLG
jgi:predicted DCC family thiol-disulfide oxidoreductase YuxK